MAHCVRGGVSYRRHKVVNRMCARCGAIEVSDEKRQELIDDAVKQMKEAEFRAIVQVLAKEYAAEAASDDRCEEMWELYGDRCNEVSGESV